MNMYVVLLVVCLQLLVLNVNSSEVRSKLREGYAKYKDLGFYKIYTTPGTWEVARQICENDNAHLVIIDSEEELELIGNMMRSEKVDEIHAGYDDLVTEGEYYTIYGQPLSSTFVRWARGEPNDLNSNEDCGDILLRDDKPGLNDMGCLEMRPFVCEVKDS